MALSAKLEMKQGQSLVMTPQLQQAIKLLQLSNIELSAYIDAELEKNPLLALDSKNIDKADATPSPDKDQPTEEYSQATDTQIKQDSSAADLDTDFENIVPDASMSSTSYASDLQNMTGSSKRSSSSSFSGGEAPNIEAYVSEERSLHDHLDDQLHMSITDPVSHMIAINLIDMVDESGYLTGDLKDIAKRLGVETSLVETVLSTLQTFEPSGVFARNVSECLRLQLEEKGALTPSFALLLENLDLLASHKLAKLKKLCECNGDQLTGMISDLRKLNPKPGLQYGFTAVQPVTPDVLVTARSDGSWQIELNSENLPKVLIDQSYISIVDKSKGDKSGKKTTDNSFLSECLLSANWLVKSLDQRAKTIMKVSEEIIRHQDDFFLKGVEHLRPLNLKTIADAIKMHESTVSRATAGKYMATSRGLFELKYFFSSSLASSSIEDSHSSESVKFKIRRMIENESLDNILSDDKVVTRLMAEDIEIARRTVAKYREALNIPSSVQRRREKKLANQNPELV